jgi:hypothetical protein
MGNLIMDSSGNLYGTTNGGGSTYNGGVAFMLSETSIGWKEKILHVFGKPGDDVGPSSLVFDASGNLFGSAPSSTNANYDKRTASYSSWFTTPAEVGVKVSCIGSRKPSTLHIPIQTSFGTTRGPLCWEQSDLTTRAHRGRCMR